MAVIDSSAWLSRTGISVSGADATSVTNFCSDVSAILTRKCYPVALEPKTLTLWAMDAPPSNELFLPLRPCRSITALYLALGANGDSTQATSDTLLTVNDDYWMPLDDALNNWSRSGRVLRRGSSVWGAEYRRPLNRLGYATDPNRGAIFISGSFGPASGVIDGAQAAAAVAVTLMFQRRKTGAPVQSESWGGYSYSAAGQFTAEAACNSPEVLGILRDAGLLPIHVG